MADEVRLTPLRVHRIQALCLKAAAAYGLACGVSTLQSSVGTKVLVSCGRCSHLGGLDCVERGSEVLRLRGAGKSKREGRGDEGDSIKKKRKEGKGSFGGWGDVGDDVKNVNPKAKKKKEKREEEEASSHVGDDDEGDSEDGSKDGPPKGEVSDSYLTSDEDEESEGDRIARTYLKDMDLEEPDMRFGADDKAAKAKAKHKMKGANKKYESESESESEPSSSQSDEESDSMPSADEQVETAEQAREKKKKIRKKGADYWLEDAERGDVASQYEVMPHARHRCLACICE